MLSILEQMAGYGKASKADAIALEKEREMHKRKSSHLAQAKKKQFVEDRNKAIESVLAYLKQEDDLVSTGDIARALNFERSYCYKLLVYMRDNNMVDSSGDERRKHWCILERIAA